ncbi:MAG TPA: type II toxin-antitoxin system HicB family antitoxin [Nitrospirae bacterium]|nr:type II toxin-antitoxin system HicB family antitoxin [Nitrospirota bacterium]
MEATSNENGNKYNVIVTRDKKDWLVSDVAELPGCHTQAKNMNDLLERTKEAIQAYLESDSSYESKVEFIKIRQI